MEIWTRMGFNCVTKWLHLEQFDVFYLATRHVNGQAQQYLAWHHLGHLKAGAGVQNKVTRALSVMANQSG